MSIAVLMQQLRDAGAPMEAIVIAVAAVEAAEAKFAAAEEARKASQRERTAKSRAKSRDCNVTVTSQPRDPAPKENNQTPTHSDSPSDPIGSSAPKGARKLRNRALPTDWQPGEKSDVARRELGRSVAWMHSTATDMRTWAESKGEVRADWDATHVGWMRREAKREGSIGPPPIGNGPRGHPAPRPSSRDAWASDAIQSHFDLTGRSDEHRGNGHDASHSPGSPDAGWRDAASPVRERSGGELVRFPAYGDPSRRRAFG